MCFWVCFLRVFVRVILSLVFLCIYGRNNWGIPWDSWGFCRANSMEFIGILGDSAGILRETWGFSVFFFRKLYEGSAVPKPSIRHAIVIGHWNLFGGFFSKNNTERLNMISADFLSTTKIPTERAPALAVGRDFWVKVWKGWIHCRFFVFLIIWPSEKILRLLNCEKISYFISRKFGE